MNLDVLDNVMSLVIWVLMACYVSFDGTVKNFKYHQGEGGSPFLRGLLIGVSLTLFIIALFLDAIKGVVFSKLYTAVITAALVVYFSDVMFRKGREYSVKENERKDKPNKLN